MTILPRGYCDKHGGYSGYSCPLCRAMEIIAEIEANVQRVKKREKKKMKVIIKE